MDNKLKKPPEFYDHNPFDPINAATGSPSPKELSASKKTMGDEKRKAGYYLSAILLERFNRKFHELKLNGFSIENKSALLEKALSFALDDIDKGFESLVLKQIEDKDKYKEKA